MQHARVHPTQESPRKPSGIPTLEAEKPFEPGKKYVDRLLGDTRDAQGNPRYSASMSRLLAITSGWAYSDAEMLSNVLHRNGLRNNRCEYIGVVNDALFVFAKAYFIQSEGGRLGILCFRGTEPSNILNWMTDASVNPETFLTDLEGKGMVHGGFYRNVMAVWPSILSSLEKALQGQAVTQPPEGADVIALPDKGRAQSREPMLHPMEALYITGHSLGAAMATLAAALLYQGVDRESESYVQLRRVLRGIYTYGQPLVGDEAFAEQCEEVAPRIFRHVYKNDIVPRLPPRATGKFKHFGQEYRWRDETQQWEYSQEDVSQARTVVLSSVIGVFGWLGQQFELLRKLKLKLPYSWEAHSPVHYMSTTIQQTPLQRAEFG
ncbi:lipase family protein [Vitiosangium sp. GDMCC 1.1324]|uniref:lipase family protein n=1 Tax=Vitiosangium sp. (strain GDMCC 1.1324) TaxID=2138576 RepID=UPI000D3B92AE|nr:lipase family protein [Vitiosangium sp. GDMCC 1.1324]PTL80051.1 hypothetical protein DAT35_32075 [Vitiosangium sp. GDMCC 1.1324]